MFRLKTLLATAALLSLVAAVGAWLKPVPPIASELRASVGSLVKLEVQPSHRAVFTRGSELYVEATVTASKELAPSGGPISFVLVLDRSGSMQGNKLAEAKRAAHALVDLLGPDDELGLVHFGSDVQQSWRQRMTSDGKRALHDAIDRVESTGATDISDALLAASEQLRDAPGARRVVLVSDGQPTAGETREDALIGYAGRLHDLGVTVTTLGVGADYNGMLMQHLSERGGGSYGYLRDGQEGVLAEILGKEVAAARTVVARDVRLEVDAVSGVVLEDAPGRWVERDGQRSIVHLADLQPGMEARVYLRLRSLPNAPAAVLASQLRYVAKEEVRTEPARLELPAVDDDALVQASRDEAVYTRGVRAAGALNLVAAAAAYERGDVALAESLLDNTRALFAMSADALAGEAEVQQVRKSFGSASSSERKHLARDLERKKLSNFGRENEGY